jgi:hypothetical protein
MTKTAPRASASAQIYLRKQPLKLTSKQYIILTCCFKPFHQGNGSP